jgi:hypothetical protein
MERKQRHRYKISKLELKFKLIATERIHHNDEEEKRRLV